MSNDPDQAADKVTTPLSLPSPRLRHMRAFTVVDGVLGVPSVSNHDAEQTRIASFCLYSEAKTSAASTREHADRHRDRTPPPLWEAAF
ncbi:hypothetical protein K523DRAFT_359213 [Schizophyllum commune Tattone D]|nr:hypothetical protein K523DRAFT_359213 [Schizophyllum commune Tattone D]